jgi:hypothetical protein
MMGDDTLRISGFAFAYTDVFALPTKRQMIYFKNDRVNVIGGHEKFVWIRNGFIFQVAGSAYVGLNVGNDLIRKDPPFAKKKLTGLGIGTAVFLFGKLLHIRFDPYWHMGKKYRLAYMSFQPDEKNKAIKPF